MWLNANVTLAHSVSHSAVAWETAPGLAVFHLGDIALLRPFSVHQFTIRMILLGFDGDQCLADTILKYPEKCDPLPFTALHQVYIVCQVGSQAGTHVLLPTLHVELYEILQGTS